jgi:hypothetical protein
MDIHIRHTINPYFIKRLHEWLTERETHHKTLSSRILKIQIYFAQNNIDNLSVFTLYNHHNARKPAHDKGSVIAVEGYVDVIAMTGAGFPNVVAPLGTALTPDQVELMWRMAEEPILCFDGDRAGRKAAHRAIDTALPLLGPGRSLRFAFLPDGQDPEVDDDAFDDDDDLDDDDDDGLDAPPPPAPPPVVATAAQVAAPKKRGPGRPRKDAAVSVAQTPLSPHRNERAKDRYVYDPVFGVIPQETRDLWKSQESDSSHRRQALLDAMKAERRTIPPIRFSAVPS